MSSFEKSQKKTKRITTKNRMRTKAKMKTAKVTPSEHAAVARLLPT
jgi:hypothetical protein